MSDKELRQAQEYADKGETDIAHSICARLAHRARRFGDKAMAKFYNKAAGYFAPDDPNDHAAGYVITEDLDDDE